MHSGCGEIGSMHWKRLWFCSLKRKERCISKKRVEVFKVVFKIWMSLARPALIACSLLPLKAVRSCLPELLYRSRYLHSANGEVRSSNNEGLDFVFPHWTWNFKGNYRWWCSLPLLVEAIGLGRAVEILGRVCAMHFVNGKYCNHSWSEQLFRIVIEVSAMEIVNDSAMGLPCARCTTCKEYQALSLSLVDWGITLWC